MSAGDLTEREIEAGVRYFGKRVTYADASATVTSLTGDVVLVTGPCNGQPIEAETSVGMMIFVPVFSPRDNGREATTVFVAESNIVEVT